MRNTPVYNSDTEKGFLYCAAKLTFFMIGEACKKAREARKENNSRASTSRKGSINFTTKEKTNNERLTQPSSPVNSNL